MIFHAVHQLSVQNQNSELIGSRSSEDALQMFSLISYVHVLQN